MLQANGQADCVLAEDVRRPSASRLRAASWMRAFPHRFPRREDDEFLYPSRGVGKGG